MELKSIKISAKSDIIEFSLNSMYINPPIMIDTIEIVIYILFILINKTTPYDIIVIIMTIVNSFHALYPNNVYRLGGIKIDKLHSFLGNVKKTRYNNLYLDKQI